MIILQIAPVIGSGSGVGAVAYHLEQEWLALGHDVRRFTLHDARGGWIPAGRGRVSSRLWHATRVLWFSTVGSVLARQAVRQLPDTAVSVCHNDALAGDVYVNHGVLAESMKARGRFAWRMVRNPLHLFTTARDAVRFAGRTHRLVVSLAKREVRALRRTYPRFRPRCVVIPNGVDTDLFRPVGRDERARLRRSLALPSEAVVLLFVGHEFQRKGLFVALDALTQLPSSHLLLAVGGTPGERRLARVRAESAGTGNRLITVGSQSDPRPYFAVADILVLPSAYEADPLVVLEALACGLPVVATDVGGVAELVLDGFNGSVTTRTPSGVAQAVRSVLAQNQEALRSRARQSAEARSWRSVAQAYLAEFRGLQDQRRSAA